MNVVFLLGKSFSGPPEPSYVLFAQLFLLR